MFLQACNNRRLGLCICALCQQLVGYHTDGTTDRQSHIVAAEHSVIRTQFRFILYETKGIHYVELTVLSHAIHDTNMASGVYMRGKLHCVTQKLLAEAARF